MAFTTAETNSIAVAALDYYFAKGEAFKQSIQARPFWDRLESRKKSFPGGKGNISLAVVGAFTDSVGATGTPTSTDVVKGYSHNDTVGFFTPANLVRANYPWREHHIGLTLTHTELKIDGISVTDTDGKGTSTHSGREMTALVNLLEDKLFALGEQYARSFNNLAYGDGTTDAKALAGIKALVRDDPSVGTPGTIDVSLATNSWWRNRAHTAAFGTKVTATPALAAHGGGAITSDPKDGGVLLQTLQKEYRQLTRYGGKPTHAFVGSDFLDAMEKELRANGIYKTNGFSAETDVSMGALKFMGTEFVYDPTLDQLGTPKRCYWLDLNNIFLMAMENEWRRSHNPARPPNQFVLYRSLTSTGQIVAKQLNSSLVMDIA